MQIGELFILRINIHLQGSVLDAPELMWAEPQLDPVYQAVRSYLEMDQRVTLLQERVGVIADLLAVLKDQLSHTHGTFLEAFTLDQTNVFMQANIWNGSSLCSSQRRFLWLPSTLLLICMRAWTKKSRRACQCTFISFV
jgi:hypothetical protein